MVARPCRNIRSPASDPPCRKYRLGDRIDNLINNHTFQFVCRNTRNFNPLVTFDAVTNDRLMINQWQGTAQIRIEKVQRRVRRKVGSEGCAICSMDGVARVSLPMREFGHSVPVGDGRVVDHGFFTCVDREDAIGSLIFLFNAPRPKRKEMTGH